VDWIRAVRRGVSTCADQDQVSAGPCRAATRRELHGGASKWGYPIGPPLRYSVRRGRRSAAPLPRIARSQAAQWTHTGARNGRWCSPPAVRLRTHRGRACSRNWVPEPRDPTHGWSPPAMRCRPVGSAEWPRLTRRAGAAQALQSHAVRAQRAAHRYQAADIGSKGAGHSRALRETDVEPRGLRAAGGAVGVSRGRPVTRSKAGQMRQCSTASTRAMDLHRAGAPPCVHGAGPSSNEQGCWPTSRSRTVVGRDADGRKPKLSGLGAAAEICATTASVLLRVQSVPDDTATAASRTRHRQALMNRCAASLNWPAGRGVKGAASDDCWRSGGTAPRVRPPWHSGTASDASRNPFGRTGVGPGACG